MNDRPKVEPSADIRAAAKSIHEMFVALADEGFTEAHALHIVGVALSAALGGQGKQP